jgi:hypothetical protein
MTVMGGFPGWPHLPQEEVPALAQKIIIDFWGRSLKNDRRET